VLLTDDLKSTANFLFCEEISYPKRGIVTGGKDIVLGVEPQHDVDLGSRFLSGQTEGREQQSGQHRKNLGN
jgi:hypothetical protein